MSHDDFDFEPIRGLPAMLPPGEQLLWQGSPDWKSLAIHAYHVRKIAIYFLLLMLWRIGAGISLGHAPSAILTSCLFLAGLGSIAIGVLALLAYGNARSTVYSITSRRVLIRHGIAVPLTMNVPHNLIDNAALKNLSNGTGDIALTVSRRERVGYLITWPHVRPGRIARPEPSLRALPDAEAAARILGLALAAQAGAAPVAVPVPEQASTVPSAVPLAIRQVAA
jgi:hypothetical protein